ncbi:MAG: hypothetical protein ABI603_05235 [Acidobacteriota bacterium]
MTDPLRTEAVAALAQVSEREREARVESLLVAGLDHYFAGHYELAINVWTRVLFLDRGHARARAYIERGRGAVSERQRQGDELVHAGAEAFDRGDPEAARRLLQSAVEQGAGHEEAMALLARLDRLTAAAVPRQHSARLPGPLPDAAGPGDARPDRRHRWTLAGICAAAAAAALLAALWVLPGGWPALVAPPPPAAAPAAGELPVPVPSAAALWLARAHAHRDRGHLREALTALDAIRPDDRQGIEAERLRAEIQAALLAAGRAAPAPLPQDSRR